MAFVSRNKRQYIEQAEDFVDQVTTKREILRMFVYCPIVYWSFLLWYWFTKPPSFST